MLLKCRCTRTPCSLVKQISWPELQRFWFSRSGKEPKWLPFSPAPRCCWCVLSANCTLETTDIGVPFRMSVSVMLLWACIGFSVNTYFMLNTFEMCHWLMLRCCSDIQRCWKADGQMCWGEVAWCCEHQAEPIHQHVWVLMCGCARLQVLQGCLLTSGCD